MVCSTTPWAIDEFKHPPPCRPAVPMHEQAARTNGAGILQLSRVFDSLAYPPSGDSSGFAVRPPVVHLVTFSYNRGSSDGGGRGGFSPAQPVGSALRQLFWLCSQVHRVGAVQWVKRGKIHHPVFAVFLSSAEIGGVVWYSELVVGCAVS